MRWSRVITIGGLALSMAAVAQNEAPKPKVSKDALTTEQIAVYRAVLEGYTNGSGSLLNVANRTEPLDQSEPFFGKSCVSGIELEAAGNSVPVVHQLDRSVIPSKRFVLVDPDRQQKKVEENDPQKLIKRCIDGHEKVTEKEVDDSVTQAFKTGLFTLTEIVFDKQHRHAVVAYSFVCGGLCGHGNTLTLKKVGRDWKVSKRCGGWIS